MPELPENLEFNDEFKRAFELIGRTSENIFITGRAGTGKSTFLNYLTHFSPKPVVVLAPTGVAAVNVGGQTIHSFFRLPPGVSVEEAKAEALNRKKREIFKKIGVLVIDEISMVRADLLDAVDVFLKTVLSSEKPFGGKQVVFIGDLYQLPPIVKTEEHPFFRETYASPYFFDAHALKAFPYTVIEFSKIYRQKDAEFIELLNRVRNKTLSPLDLQKINARYQEIGNDRGFIHLVTTNKMAEEINQKKLAEIRETGYNIRGSLEGEFKHESLPTEEILHLKKGAQIMFLVNDPGRRWVNGTLAAITHVSSDTIQAQTTEGRTVTISPHTWELGKYAFNPLTQSIEKKVTGTFTQYPLRLAWAITIHKSQGKTFSRIILDIGTGTFATGQLYVALSRATSLQGIVLKKPLHLQHVLTDPKIADYMEKTKKEQSGPSFTDAGKTAGLFSG